MAHSGAPSAVNIPPTAPEKAKKPLVGEIKVFHDHNGSPAFEVKFKDSKTVEIKRVGDADITRKIVPKYGNIRATEGHLKQAADLAAWFLFNLTDSN